MKSIAQLPVIGMDIAKNVFQLHIVDADTGKIQLRKIKRAKVAECFVNLVPSMVAAQAIPGVGPLTATALVATVADLSTFRSGRQFAAWLGLTPRQVGTGGKTQQLGISKRGDTYLRTLLISGARAVVNRSAHTNWIDRLLERRHFNVVVTALANKMARTAWAILVKGKAFDQAKWNPTEPAVV